MASDTEQVRAYVGISGVTSIEDETRLVKHAAALGMFASRVLLFGVKATPKTQLQEIENKYGRLWYPVGDQLRTAATRRPEVMNVIQVAVTDELYADGLQSGALIQSFVELVLERGGEWVDGLQFDLLPWHQNDALADYLAGLRQRRATTGRHLAVILQCHREAMDILRPEGVANKLGSYAAAGAFDYVLFDASHGQGQPLNAERLGSFIAAACANEQLAGVGVGIAGGLDATAAEAVLPALTAQYPNLSWDAEGKLHPPQADGVRPLDMEQATAYLEASAAVLRQIV